jgi:hypothetical protein
LCATQVDASGDKRVDTQEVTDYLVKKQEEVAAAAKAGKSSLSDGLTADGLAAIEASGPLTLHPVFARLLPDARLDKTRLRLAGREGAPVACVQHVTLPARCAQAIMRRMEKENTDDAMGEHEWEQLFVDWSAKDVLRYTSVKLTKEQQEATLSSARANDAHAQKEKDDRVRHARALMFQWLGGLSVWPQAVGGCC